MNRPDRPRRTPAVARAARGAVVVLAAGVLLPAAVTTARADAIPPAAVADLTVIIVSNNRVGLRWTTTGDDGNVGIATSFDIRFAAFAINAANFGAATPAAGEPVPGPPGTQQMFAVSGLPASSARWFAMKVLDEDATPSAISNIVMATTTASDTAAPSTVTLAGTPDGFGSVSLTWTAPGDDGPFGQALGGYDLRRAATPITTLLLFNAAIPIAGEPVPAPAGTPQGMTVAGLTPGADWYFAVRAFDEAANGSAVPSAAMFVATLPQYLEFGPITNAARIETIATDYSAVTSLGGGNWRLSGTATATMGGFDRTFNFANLDTASAGETANDGVSRALRVTAGTVTVNIAADPIVYPAPDDLNLTLLSFRLGATGGQIIPGGLRITLPPNMTSTIGPVLTFFVTTPLEQDLDFTVSLQPGGGFYFAPKDYPFRIAPQAGVSYQVTRQRVELGLSDYTYVDKERGTDPLLPGPDRCASIPGACLEKYNDGVLGLSWTLNQYAGGAPPGSIGAPFFERDGLRATLYLTADGTFHPLFPAGVVAPLSLGSRIEFVDTEPAGGSLQGAIGLDFATGVIAALDDLGLPPQPSDDCTGSGSLIADFSGGEMLAGGQIRIAALTPGGPGFDEIHWGGRGVDLGDIGGFFAGDLGAGNLSYYAPGTVARVAAASARPTVEAHLLAEQDDASGEGTYAGVNIALSVGDPGTVGMDTTCPDPASTATGHSLAVASNASMLHVRKAGVTGIADGGVIDPLLPFPYMGYDMALSNFSVAFLDNVPAGESGLVIGSLHIPQPSDIDFSFTTGAAVNGCGELPGTLGEMANAGTEQTLLCWEADFTPYAARMERQDAATCPGDPPLNCAIPAEEVRYVHLSADAPLELEPGAPAQARYADILPMDFGPKPDGTLACSDIIPAAAGGTVRNEFEPDYGFDVDLEHVHLMPPDASASCAAVGGPQGGSALEAGPGPQAGPGPAPAVDPDTPRYEATGETHFPFYGGTASCSVVTQGRVEWGALCDLAGRVHVNRPVFGGLFDLDFDLEYFEPIRNPSQGEPRFKTPGRFLAKSGHLDLKLVEIPISTKILGRLRDPALLAEEQYEAFPDLYLGFLSDVSAYAEAVADNDVCDLDCINRLGTLIQLDLEHPEIGLDELLPGLKGKWDDIAKATAALGIKNPKSVVAGALQDTVGSILPVDFAPAADRALGLVKGIGAADDVFKTKDMTGAGAFGKILDDPLVKDHVLDTAKIDTKVDVLNFVKFPGFVEFNRHTANAADDTEDTSDVTVGAHNVDLGWAIDGVKAKTIQGTFYFDTSPAFTVTGFEGLVELTGLKFGDVSVDEAGLALGMGNPGPGDDFYYVAAAISARYKTVSAEAGFFIGKSISIEPLVMVDPDVGEMLAGLERLDGIYMRAGASFPFLSGPDCFPWNLTAGGSIAFWYFAEGPTYGAKQRTYAHGDLVCVVKARADLTLLGGLVGDVWHFAGNGFVAGGVGACEPEEWTSRGKVLNDDWCLACVLSGEFRTDSESDEFDGDLRGPDCD